MTDELTVWDAILLGIIQGFTEWLPISSSGHLVVAHEFFTIPSNASFDVVLMVGTNLALIIYFREKIISLIKGVLNRDSAALRYIFLMVCAGIPTALIGFAGRTFFVSLFSAPLIVSALIMVTGFFLLLASRATPHLSEMSWRDALLIGIAQGLAVAPGISRSGSTLGTALLLGLPKREAAHFSFLIGIPTMVIATIFEWDGATTSGIDVSLVLVGIVTSFIAGYSSIAFLMKLLESERLSLFGYYGVIAGALFFLLILLF